MWVARDKAIEVGIFKFFGPYFMSLPALYGCHRVVGLNVCTADFQSFLVSLPPFHAPISSFQNGNVYFVHCILYLVFFFFLQGLIAKSLP
jgi:hypothetical protein